MKFLLPTALLMMILSVNLNSQVTIGHDVSPIKGALLQLKENEGTAENSTKGFMLSRVKITNLNNLDDISAGLNTTDHIGLTVYNTNIELCATTPAITPGAYMWMGNKWERLDNDGRDFTSEVKSFIDMRDPAKPETYLYRKFGPAGYWMVEHLRATTMPDGRAIPLVIPIGMNPHHFLGMGYPSKTTTGWNVQTNPKWGVFYNWYTATDGRILKNIDQRQIDPAANGGKPGPNEVETVEETIPGSHNGKIQGICPQGWHLPSDREWNALEKELYSFPENYSFYTSSDKAQFIPVNWNPEWEFGSTTHARGSTSLTKGHNLVAVSSCFVSPKLDYIREASLPAAQGGFDLLLVGNIHLDQASLYSSVAYLHSSTANNSRAIGRAFYAFNRDVGRGEFTDWNLYSVRCKKDEN